MHNEAFQIISQKTVVLVPLVFGDCERLVVLAVVGYTAGAAGSSVRANFSTEES